MKTSTLPQELMSGSLLHFEQGVPIDDLALRTEQRKRLARVEHVYWQWMRNPFIDTYQLFRQLVKGHYADKPSETRAAQKDHQLFEFVKESLTGMSRKDAQMKVKVAAEKAIRIGMETDNVQALTKGGKLLYEVAGLDKPETEQTDMSKLMFLPPVVVTDISQVDDTKENVDDAEMKRIMAKYDGFVDDKMKDVDDMVATMEARSGISQNENETPDE